ncbi:MAG TPA: GAF domain-containing sensor histidine kinase [Anaerolineales bacterium]
MSLRKQVAAISANRVRWRQILRLGWYTASVLTGGLFLAALSGFVQKYPMMRAVGARTYEFTSTFGSLNLIAVLISTGIGVLCLVLAAILFRRQPNDKTALLLSYYLLGHGVFVAGPYEALEPFLPGIVDITIIFIQPMLMVPMALLLLAVFPDGRFVPSWSRWIVLVSFLVGPLAYIFAYRPTGDFSNPWVILFSFLYLPILIAMVYAQVHRYRYVSSLQERQQTKWVLYGIALWTGFQVIGLLFFLYLQTMPSGSQLSWLAPINVMFWAISNGFFPISLTIALTRYRLYDIDLLINRTLVYGAITGSVIALYILIVAVAGLIIQSNLKLAGLLITAVVASVLYRPVQALFQRSADRILPPILAPSTKPPVRQGQESLRLPDPATQVDQNGVGAWGRVLKPIWVVSAVLAVAVLIVSLPGYVVRMPIGNLGSDLVFKPTSLMLAIHHLNSLVSILSAILSLSLASLLFIKKSGERIGLFLAFYLLAHGILFAGPIEMLEPVWPNVAWVNSFILLPVFTGPATAALVGLFPDGRFVPLWSRWLIPASMLVFPAALLMARGGPSPGSGPQGWALTGIVVGLSVAIFVALLYVPVYRYRNASTPEQRRQTKWVVYGIFVGFVFLLISSVPWMMALNLPPGSLIPWWLLAAQLFWSVSTALFPVTLTIAVMRYRLYEIDIIINRTLVYGALTVSVIALYALTVGAFGVLFQFGGNLVISLLATGLVAVLFQPLRERLQRGVNRLMYGERDDPATVFSRLGDLLEASASPQELLPGLVRTIAQTLKLPYAAIELGQGSRPEVVAEHGSYSEESERFPLVYQSEVIGSLVVSPRARREDFGATDRQLLENIARQAGAVAHAVHLTHELQRSRLRLVTAREEERRRLRRDLHDELGPQLASQTLIIEALEKRLNQDPASAARLLEELKKQSRRAVKDIRQIVYDLRPPALDDLGLTGALREALASYQRSGIAFNLQSMDEIPPLPAAVEVAAYRIVQEAVTNVIRHANAGRCLVSIDYREGKENALLQLTVEDDGQGFRAGRHNGVGLNSMRERAAELGGSFTIEGISGGGTRVRAQLPINQRVE